ncbi:hypothetical protein ACIQXQ_07580 [Peribacillus sp. NPDC097198]|uniref:hypothetical protein n=1 Tax=Peribacillus sp. NPDC097198 TaxID=3364397 RepID=UPI00382CBE8F
MKPWEKIIGDRVFGSCVGSHAEYVCPKENVLTFMPNNATFEEAAAIPCAAQTALQALRDVGKLKAGDKVLIYGASGGVGHFAVQLAVDFGAEVTAVCSTSYIQEDFAHNGKNTMSFITPTKTAVSETFTAAINQSPDSNG